jgi:hypothetical protein
LLRLDKPLTINRKRGLSGDALYGSAPVMKAHTGSADGTSSDALPLSGRTKQKKTTG